MKTPDEIKEGLECCSGIVRPCEGCAYRHIKECAAENAGDALAYIQQLERERDAAVEDLKNRCYTGRSMCCYCK